MASSGPSQLRSLAETLEAAARALEQVSALETKIAALKAEIERLRRDPEPEPEPPSGETRNAALWPFASDSVWNTSLGSGAVLEPADAPKTRNLGAGDAYINARAYSVQPVIAKDGDPEYLVVVDNTADYTHRVPAETQISVGTDLKVAVIDRGTCYEYWKARWTSEGKLAAVYGRNVDLLGPGINRGIRASRFSVLGGLIRKHELDGRYIPHALSVSLEATQLKRGFVWPAYSQDSNSSDYKGLIPMGSMVALPPDVAPAGLSPEGEALATAFRDYGGYVGDRAGNTVLHATPECEGPALDRLRDDWAKILPLLRIVENSTQNSVGGGGTRRRPPAPTPVIASVT